MVISNKYGEIKTFRELFDILPEELQKTVWSLKDIPQRKDFHPEGNTLKHVIIVVNRAIENGDINLTAAALFHDIGKKDTLKIKFGKPVTYGHDKESTRYVFEYRQWIRDFGACPVAVFNIVRQHMRLKQYKFMRRSKRRKLKNNPYYDYIEAFSGIDRGGY